MGLAVQSRHWWRTLDIRYALNSSLLVFIEIPASTDISPVFFLPFGFGVAARSAFFCDHPPAKGSVLHLVGTERVRGLKSYVRGMCFKYAQSLV